MRTSDYVGEGPHDIDCPQVGSEDYYKTGKEHCRKWIDTLRRVYGEEPEGSTLYVKSNPHDFGSYYTVEYRYNDDNEEHQDYFLLIEEGTLGWDDEPKPKEKPTPLADMIAANPERYVTPFGVG